jgi:electron transfer flavoprotein alpha subunit
MSCGILTVAEVRGGRLPRASLEALGAARHVLGLRPGPLSAAIVGAEVRALAEQLGIRGVDAVYVFEDATLAGSTTEVHVRALAALVSEIEPELVLIPDSAYGRDVASRLSARLKVGLATGCLRFALSPEGDLVGERHVFGGRFVQRVSWRGAPRLATIRTGVFDVPPAAPSARATLVARQVESSARARIVSVVVNADLATSPPDIEEARVVVAAGRGLGGPEQLRLVEELAEALGGAIGASRAAVDLGWLDHQHQIGQTGRSVAPDVYVACGISGAIQHLAGIGSARTIVAINRDSEAAIFGAADYGIVGEIEQVLPRLSAALRAERAGRDESSP